MMGIMVGNGVTDFRYDADPVLPEVHLNFQIIPQKVFDNYTDNECFYSIRNVIPGINNTKECDSIRD